MTTLLEFREILYRFLKDSEGAQFTDDLLLDGINEAQIAVLPWFAKQRTQAYNGDGSTKSFSIPADLYSIDGLLYDKDDGNAVFLEQFSIRAGEIFDDNLSEITYMWVDSSSDGLVVSEAPLSGQTLTLYYKAYWDALSSDSESLLQPNWVQRGMLYYAAAYVLSPDAVSMANIRQFATRIDSGNPEHNSLIVMIDWLLKRFESEMERHQAQEKGVLFR